MLEEHGVDRRIDERKKGRLIDGWRRARNAPSLRYLNTNPAFFFERDGTPTGGFNRDGRASSLIEQAQVFAPGQQPRRTGNSQPEHEQQGPESNHLHAALPLQDYAVLTPLHSP
mgnify:CR=1 FL=1